MAEESTDSLLLTPEKNELDFLNAGKNSAEFSDSDSLNNGDSTDSPHDRASTGIYPKGDDCRSNSTEKLESANREMIPHYLRASTGSCHELCKYGRKHEFEEKTRTPLRNQIAKMSPTEQNGVCKKNSPGLQLSLDIKFVSPKLKPSLDRCPVSSMKKASSGTKIPLTKHKISPCKKTPSPDPTEVIMRETLSTSRNFEIPIEHGSLSDSEVLTPTEQNGVGEKNSPGLQLSPDIKFVSPKLKPSLDRYPVSSMKKASSGNKIPLTKHKISLCKKTPSPDPTEVIMRETLSPSRKLEIPIEHASLSDCEMLTTTASIPSNLGMNFLMWSSTASSAFRSHIQKKWKPYISHVSLQAFP